MNSNWSYSPETPNLGQIWRFLEPCDLEIWRMTLKNKHGKSEWFDSCDWPSNLKLDSNRQFFRPCDRDICWMTPKNNRTLLLYYVKLCASFQTGFYSPETLNSGRYWWNVMLCDLEIWCMTLENNRASLLCCFKLCASFHSHLWIQTGVTVRKRPIWVKFNDF